MSKGFGTLIDEIIKEGMKKMKWESRISKNKEILWKRKNILKLREFMRTMY